jgi:3'-5' exoribonuclease
LGGSASVAAVNTTETSPEATSPTPPPAEEPQAASVASPSQETVRKVYARNVREKDRIETVFLVTRKNRHVARSGKVLLQVLLADKTGELDARIFDRVEQLESVFAQGDYVLVRGNVGVHHGKPQLVIESLERLDPSPMDPAEFTPPPPQPQAESPRPESGAQNVVRIRELVERVQDPNVKTLLLAFLDDPEIATGLPKAPAAKGIHHAYRGGLAEHILSVMKLAHRMADHYPMVDRDLLVAGALLHDICKVGELSYEKNFDYSDEGRLVGHLVMTAQKIREKAATIPGFPRLLEHHITHIVLAHHGQLEYGSPKLPMTLEAYIVHMIDSLDSRVASWLELMAKDPNDKWTEVSRLYERHLWKGAVPTSRNRPPVETRPGSGGGKRKDRKRHGGDKPAVPAEPPEAREASKDREPVPARKDREHRKDRDSREAKPNVLPKELTFKPFSALAGSDSKDSNGDPS